MKYIVLLILFPIVLNISFRFDLPPYTTQCFYQQFNHQGKYNVEITPEGNVNYQFTISTEGRSSQQIYKKVTNGEHYQGIKLSKFATQSNTYSFCLNNLGTDNLRLNFQLKSGIELMELDVLPDLKDNDYLDREVKLLETHQQNIFNSLQNVQSSKAYTQAMFNLMSTKTLGFGILGFIVIIIVNLLFYKQIKKTLKERKLI